MSTLDISFITPPGFLCWQVLDDPKLLDCTDLRAPLERLFDFLAS
jgi:hypothetical protein